MESLKSRIKSGGTVHGCWINLGSHVSAEIIGKAGFDWTLIDLEHGAGGEAMLYHQLQALSNCPSETIVRVDEISRPKVQKILDSGALGIMFPQIMDQEEARSAMNTMFYPPDGVRGTAKMVRVAEFGKNFEAYRSTLKERLIGIIQIETMEAVDQVNDIARIEGVDVLFIGPSDLTIRMGIFNQFDHPDYRNAIEKVSEAARNAGKTAGILLQDVSEYETYFRLGFRFLACGADSVFVVKGAHQLCNALNVERNKFM